MKETKASLSETFSFFVLFFFFVLVFQKSPVKLERVGRFIKNKKNVFL